VKKIILIFLFIFIAVILSSCKHFVFIAPIGTWQSDFPAIKFEVNDDSIDYYGVFVNGSDEIEIVAFFSEFDYRFGIYDRIIMNGSLGEPTVNFQFFDGNYTISDDIITYVLTPRWQEIHGFSEIIFTRISD
jgi:hypothetical protein